MSAAQDATGFFVLGGTLRRDAPSYVTRPADDDLLRLTRAGEWCNVLAARQMGKSSLMVRTVDRLKAHNVRSVVIDLTAIGSDVSASEWYFGLVTRIARQLRLKTDEQAWWQARSETSPVQKFSDFVREVALEEIPDPVVVFVDEIDSTLRLPFTDDFFAAVRALYNARSTDGVYERLTFVLLGVARPADLIKDRSRTPYNIGANVDLTDFTFEEARGVFAPVLGAAHAGQGADILRWVLAWTGGQPYLTQKLCAEIAAHHDGRVAESDIDRWVERLFLADEARKERNLQAIRDRVLTSSSKAAVLKIYQKVVAGQRVSDEERSIEKNELKLTGLVSATPDGRLATRNRVYARVFDAAWTKENLPVDRSRRLAVAGIAVAIVAVMVAVVLPIVQKPLVQAQTLVDQFNGSQSVEVRLSSLAALIKVDEARARELASGLSQQEALALFSLDDPQTVADDLVTVVEAFYQGIENNSDGNAVLRAMEDSLRKVQAAGATSLALEIRSWRQGREKAGQGEHSAAISLFDSALEESRSRNHENASIWYDRGVSDAARSNYDEALVDFEKVLEIDPSRADAVAAVVIADPAMAAHWAEGVPKQYPQLSAVLPTLTPVPTPTPTLRPIPASIPGASKIGLHVLLGPRTGYGDFLLKLHDSGARLAIVVVTDDFGPAQEAKSVFGPDVLTVGRLFTAPDKAGITVDLQGYNPLKPDGSYVDAGEVAQQYYEIVKPVWQAHPEIDVWETFNEFSANWDWQSDFYIAMMKLAEADGFRISLYGASTGNPPDAAARQMIPALQYAKGHGHFLSLHEYGGVGTDVQTLKGTEPFHALRYRSLYETILIPNNADPPLLLTEVGEAGGILFLGTEVLLDDVRWYDSELARDGYVIGAAIWTLGSVSPFSGANIQEALPDLADYIISRISNSPAFTPAPTPVAPATSTSPPSATRVPSPTPIVISSEVNLIELAPSANWSNASGETGLWLDAYPTESNALAARGYAAYVPPDRTLETGTIVGDRLVLATHPQFVPDGVIQAEFILHLPPQGARFYASLEFLAGAEPDTDGVHVEVWWYDSARGDAPGVLLDAKDASDNRSATDINRNLSLYGGQTGELRIIVRAGATSNNDWLAWTAMLVSPNP